MSVLHRRQSNRTAGRFRYIAVCLCAPCAFVPAHACVAFSLSSSCLCESSQASFPGDLTGTATVDHTLVQANRGIWRKFQHFLLDQFALITLGYDMVGRQKTDPDWKVLCVVLFFVYGCLRFVLCCLVFERSACLSFHAFFVPFLRVV